MKIRLMILICLTGVVILLAGYEANSAESQGDKESLKIGVVSIAKIIQNCQRITKYKEKTIAEQGKIDAELNRLTKEIEAETAGLRTLKVNSDDYMAQVKEIFTKQANLQAQQKFYEQQGPLKEQRMIEELYKDILHETGNIARQKGLAMVFEKSEPELPSQSYAELTTIIRTHKLLYSEGCVDITNDVMAKVDVIN
ncbi:MAG: OmpH family outer membrane protein [Planctomycetota bacterium]